MIILIKIIIVFVCLEMFLHFLLRFLRKDFQWLILKSIDEKPVIPKEKVKRFLINGYDKELGWVRRPNTSSNEKVISQGQNINANEKSTNFSIDSKGCRTNVNHENLPVKIACYGDSFAFARHVNDDETWEWYLSELNNSNVLNYGVGNYGFDQSILRFQREHKNHNAPITIIAVVPETICRIQSVWKHYSEYGNLLAFKPRFLKDSEGLKFFPNLIDCEEKLYDYSECLADLQKNDYFYKNKFEKDILAFPYIFNIMKNIKRNIPLIFTLFLKKFSLCKNLPWEIILKENFKHSKNQFKNKNAIDLFLALISHYKDCAEKLNTKPIFVFFPYLNDLKYAAKHGSYYSKFCDVAKKEIPFLDLTECFLNEQDWLNLYNNDFYGGHLSALGNEIAAKYIDNFLKNQQI